VLAVGVAGSPARLSGLADPAVGEFEALHEDGFGEIEIDPERD
jgi:hypothetical protein